MTYNKDGFSSLTSKEEKEIYMNKSITVTPTSIPTNLLLAILYFVGKYGAETLIKSIIELNKTNITLDDITNLQSTIKRPEDYFNKR